MFSTVHLLVLSFYWKRGLSWHLFQNWSSSQTTSIISHVQLFYPYAVAPGTVTFFSSLSLSFYHTFWTRRNEGEPANPHTSHLQQIQENKKPGMRETEVKGPAAERELFVGSWHNLCWDWIWLCICSSLHKIINICSARLWKSNVCDTVVSVMLPVVFASEGTLSLPEN